MIEILRAVVDLLSQLGPGLARARRGRQLREAAAPLFILYVRLNEALLCAGRIVDILAQHVSGARIPGDLPYEVAKQYVTLRRISGLLESERIRLILMDAEVYQRLVPLIDAKASALVELIDALRGRRLPIGPPEPTMQELLTSRGWQESAGLEETKRFFRALAGVGSNAIDVTGRLDDQNRERVAVYLRTRDPRAQLGQIQEAVRQLREALVTHFTVEEMMLAVGDRHFDTDS